MRGPNAFRGIALLAVVVVAAAVVVVRAGAMPGDAILPAAGVASAGAGANNNGDLCAVGEPLTPLAEALRPFRQDHTSPYHQGDLLHHSVWTATAAENALEAVARSYTSSSAGIGVSGATGAGEANPAFGLDARDPRLVRVLTLAAFLHDAGKGGASATDTQVPKSVHRTGGADTNPVHVDRGFQVLAPAAGTADVPHQPYWLPRATARRVAALCRDCVVTSPATGDAVFVFDAFYRYVNRHFAAVDAEREALSTTPYNALPRRHFRRPATLDTETAKLMALLSGMHYEFGNLHVAHDKGGDAALHAAVHVFFERLQARVQAVVLVRGITTRLLRQIVVVCVADVTGNVPVVRTATATATSTADQWLLRTRPQCPAPSSNPRRSAIVQSGYTRWRYADATAPMRAAVLDYFYRAMPDAQSLAADVASDRSGLQLSAGNFDALLQARRTSAVAASHARDQLVELLARFKFADLKKSNAKAFALKPEQKLAAILTRIRHAPLLARFQPSAPTIPAGVPSGVVVRYTPLIDAFLTECGLATSASGATAFARVRPAVAPRYKNQFELAYAASGSDDVPPLTARAEAEQQVFGYAHVDDPSPLVGTGPCTTALCAERPKYFVLDLFGSSSGSPGSAAFTVRSGAPLRAAATLTARPLHETLGARAQRVVVTADIVGGATRAYDPRGHRDDTDVHGDVVDGDGDSALRDDVGTFDHFEHVLLHYVQSALPSDTAREAFLADLLDCSADRCSSRRTRAALGASDVEHVWEVQVHASTVPFSLLNGVRSDWRAPQLAKPDKKPKQEKLSKAEKEKRAAAARKKAEEERRKRAAALKARDAKAKAKAKALADRRAKEEDELDLIGRRGANGPLGRLIEPAPAPRPAFGSEIGVKLRALAEANAWPLAWCAPADAQGRARVVMDLAAVPAGGAGPEGVAYSFDSRCRFVKGVRARPVRDAATGERLPSLGSAAAFDDAWQNLSAPVVVSTEAAEHTWDQMWAQIDRTEYVC